jgi:hypothetical protein
MNLNPLNLAADSWTPELNPSEFKIAVYLYGLAAGTSDRRVNQSIREIAKAISLGRRTVLPALHRLNRDERRVIRILSKGKEKTLIEIPPEHWPLLGGHAEPAAVEPPVINPKPVIGPPVNNSEPVVEPPASIEELVRSLAGHRPSAEALAPMKIAAGNDDQRLQDCLNSFLLHPKSRWATVDGLTVSVQHYFKVRDPSTKYWTRP